MITLIKTGQFSFLRKHTDIEFNFISEQDNDYKGIINLNNYALSQHIAGTSTKPLGTVKIRQFKVKLLVNWAKKRKLSVLCLF